MTIAPLFLRHATCERVFEHAKTREKPPPPPLAGGEATSVYAAGGWQLDHTRSKSS